MIDRRQLIGYLTKKPSRHPYPKHMEHGRRLGAEGMVLLKNEGNVLPLKQEKIALFGAGAVDTIYCGTGSGYVFAPYRISVMQGLKNAGIRFTSEAWLKRFQQTSAKANKEDKTLSGLDRSWSGLSILIDDLEITEEEMKQAAEADTAVYIVRRNAGENNDRKEEKGDYYLSEMEEKNLRKIAQKFRHVIVVLNTCVIDAGFIYDIPGIDGALLMGLPGGEAGNSLADVLLGKVNPSGRLTDTWAKCYTDNPASASFGDNDGDSMQEDYTEDIYVGYRYFDSFGVEPLFHFGYGLSYTEFQMKLLKIEADWEKITAEVQVINTGKVKGRQVVQVYASAPEGKIKKVYQKLVGFAKTKELKSSECETVKITFPTEELCSYDEERAAFVMEKGVYQIYIAEHSRHVLDAAQISLDQEAILRQVRNEMSPDHEMQLLTAENLQMPEMDCSEEHRICLYTEMCKTVDGACSSKEADRVNRAYMQDAEADFSSTLVDVKEGRVRMKDFVASLDEETLVRLVTGNASETPYQVERRLKRRVRKVNGPMSSGATTSMFVKTLGIPNWLVTDGPAGLHLPMCGATCYPVGMSLAQTWDLDGVRQMGKEIAEELRYYNYSIILGPGANIHRDPLCGRNFEYYSEDPVLSGKMAAAVTAGVQSDAGTGVALKHFACNNQEANRLETNSTVSEQALREIYLKGFEICVREAQPKTIMTSYNCINGIHASSHYELLTEIARGEWGFRGIFMTDWNTKSDKSMDLHAGNDLIMGGYKSQFLLSEMHGDEPEFAEDGYVKTQDFKVFGGFFTEHVEYWNTFRPESGGPDIVQTVIPAGKAKNAKVEEMVQKKIASLSENADGSITVTYRGVRLGRRLELEDVQVCVVRVLEQLMNSVSYDIMLKKRGKNE